MTNIEVIKRFLNKRAGHTPLRLTQNGYKEMTLKTNGLELINYSTRIAYWENGILYLNTNKYSRTTSKIQKDLKDLAISSDLKIIEYSN